MEENREYTGMEDISTLLKNEENTQKAFNNIEYVDMDSLKIKKADIGEQQRVMASIFSAKPSFQVTCSQSGYMAKMSAMVYKDIVAITNSNLSNYENKKEVYKILHSKITGFSAENWHPNFEEWLKATSLGDVETLFYGLYCATFQDKSTIRFECPWCHTLNIVQIDNKKLVRVNDRQEMMELTSKISKEADSVEKIKEFSLVSDKKENYINLKLPVSKLLFSIKMPSLYKTLDILKSFSEEEIANKSTDALNIMLSTDKVAMPCEDGSYSYIQSKKDIFALIDILDIDDFAALKYVVNELLESKHISYCLEQQKCTQCEKEIAQIPLDIETLLFFQISEKRLS